MPNDSASGGYLRPVGAQAPQGEAFEDQLLDVVTSITGLDEDLVRPRWVPTPREQPPADTNWASLGITESRTEGTPAVVHDPAGEGSSVLIDHETLKLLASFFGPDSSAYARVLRAGLFIAQNREAMSLQGMALVSVAEIVTAPALVNEQWVHRFDLAFTVRRRVERVYAVLNLKSAHGTVRVPTASLPFDTER